MKGHSEINRYVAGCKPLIVFHRGANIEGVHQGAVVAVTADGRMIASVGVPSLLALLRSCAKPFQLMTVIASGAVERFGLSDDELAVAAASHSAEPAHLKAVKSILKKTGLSEDSLRCGVHVPFMPHVTKMLAEQGIEPGRIHNNCSGKHAAMLAACLAQGWSIDDYEASSHPLQKENLARTAAFADMPADAVGVAVDGCTVPTFSLPLQAAAMAYARIADTKYAPENDKESAQRVFRIMNENPALGSGENGRLEAELMALKPGTIIAKVGAEAFFAVAVAPGVLDERGVGIVVKLAEGITFNRACDPVVVAALHQLGVLNESDLSQLSSFYPKAITDCRGGAVGNIEILFKLR